MSVSGVSVSVQNDIFDSLDDLRYDGPMLKTDVFENAITEGLESIHFTTLVEWITTQLNGFTGLDERVQATAGLEDVENFLMELSGFLREYGCPHRILTEGPLQQRFCSKESRLLLLDYLLTELLAARIVSYKKSTGTGLGREYSKTHVSCSIKDQLQDLAICFGMSELQDDLSASALFSELGDRICQSLSTGPSGRAVKPVFSALTPSGYDWGNIEYISQALQQDYACRRQMLMQRLDVTIQSFSWSEKIAKNKDQLSSVYHSIRAKMSPNTEISVSHLLAAREDILEIEKTCGGPARERTKCGINHVLIGDVPDRGGRPREMDRPRPEMPAFQQRRSQQKGGQDQRGSSNQRPNSGWQNAKRQR